MRVLVTGGAGYVGSHVALELAAAGHEPVLLDNFSNASRAALPALAELAERPLTSVAGDVRDAALLNRLFAAQAFGAVVHLAALKAVGESVADPLRYYANNVVGTACLLEAMAAHGVRSLVFSSTATVYRPDAGPLSEDSPLGPASPYARTKLVAEGVLRDLCAADPRWRVSILRYFNAAGAHPSGRIGEDPAGPSRNLLPRVADVAAGDGASWLDVFGDDWPTPDGTCVRDYVHIADLAHAHVLALERLAAGAAVHNLGTGCGHSVLEVVRAFRRASAAAVPLRIAPRRPGDVAALTADPGRAREALGWTARRGLDHICEDLWRWRSSRPA